MKEIFLDEKNELIDEEKWKSFIGSIKTNFDSLETNKERAKRILRVKIIDAVKKRTENLDKFGILFSGGVDSSLIALICKQLNLNFTCYSIGLENSQDIEAAKKVTEYYNINLKYKILSLEEFEVILKNVVKILNSSEIVWVSVGSVLYAAGKLALENNDKILFGGLGSEELFAGYQRHEEALKLDKFEELHEEAKESQKTDKKAKIKPIEDILK